MLIITKNKSDYFVFNVASMEMEFKKLFVFIFFFNTKIKKIFFNTIKKLYFT